MSPEKGPFHTENSFRKQHISGDVLVFGGVNDKISNFEGFRIIILFGFARFVGFLEADLAQRRRMKLHFFNRYLSQVEHMNGLKMS